MAKSNNTPQPFQTNAVMTDTILNNQTLTIKAPATLSNAIVAFEFYQGGNPVTTGVSGSLSITGKWQNGRNRSLGTTNLATTDFTTISGLFSSFTFSLTGLVGADSVVVSVVQYSNIISIPSSADGGALSLSVISPDGSIVETAPSTYNGLTRTITAYLQAVGGGGVADYTKYNYPISCKNTPTFTAGEEYILALPAFDGEAQYQLVFKGGYQAGAGQYGSINIDLSIIFNDANSYQRWGIVINSITQANGIVIPQSQLNELFTFTAYNTTPVVINGASISGVVLAIKLNSALPYTGTKNSLTGLFSTNNIINYTNGANPNNAALLGITNGALTSGLGEEENGLETVATLTPYFAIQTNVPNMVENSIQTYKNGLLSNSGLFVSNIVKKYVKYFFIDPDNGVDANTTVNNGSMNAPFKTVAYALTIAPTGTSIVLLGKTTEAALTITKANMDIMTFGTRSALAGFTNKVTVNNTVAGSSIRFTGLSFDGGIEPATTNVGGIYLYGGQTTAAFAKNDAGYMEMVGFDCSNNTVTVNKGQLVVNGGKTLAPTITGTGTQVTFDNVGLVLGNASVAANSVFLAFETNWVAGTTGAAIAGAVGSTVVLDGINFTRANGTRANLTLNGSYDFQHCDFDPTGSTFGTLIGVPDNFTRMRLWQAPVITTATQMYVKDPVTGEMSLQDIGTTPAIAGSALYMNNWGADQPVTNGFISLTGANAVAVGSDISYSGTGTDIALVAGKNYDFTVAINSRQNGVPSASLNTMGYSDSTFTTDNIAVTNGSITNNVYTCTGTSGTAQFVQAYDTQGVMNAFTPRAVIYPTQMAISPVSTTTNLYTYTQLSTTGVQPTIVKNGAISSQALTRNTSTGGITGDNNTAFDHPFNGSNPVEYAACASHGDVSVVSDSLNATRFAFSKTGGVSYTSQTTPLANTVTLESSLTACYARDIGIAMFVGTSGISCRIDVNAGTFTQVNISQQGAKQVVRGNLSGTMNFVAVGNSNTWNQFIKSTDGSSWLTIAANNLPSILPTTGTVTPVYSMGGICQTKDSLKAWIVAVNDTANNITYLCSSSDLVSFSSLASTASKMLENATTPELLELKAKLPTNLNATIQSYSGFNVNGLFCELVSGVGLAAGASSIIMYSSNTSGANNKVVYNNVFWASPSYWVTLSNPASISGSQRGFMYPSGVFGLWATGGTANLISTCDGGLTWVTKTNLTSFTYMMPLGDYQLCSCSTVSASRKYSATYRNNYVTTMLYNAVWAGGQKLQAGTSVNPVITLTDQTIATYSYSDSGAMLLIGALLTPKQTHEFFSVGVTGINKSEKVSLLDGTGYVIQNTFLWTMVGTNCTVTTTTQAPGVQGNIQTSILGLITNVQANATVRLKCDYNNGTNTLGGANSIKITKL